jgi:hypothetical protein
MIRLAAAKPALAAPVLALAALALSACSPAPSPGSQAIDGDAAIALDDGWVRIPPGGRDVTAGFIAVTATYNTRLIAVSSPEADRIEMHTMAMEGDIMRMREVDGYDIRADEPFRLESGGDHLMIFGLTPGALDDGEMVIALEFEDGERVSGTLPARVSAPE